MNSKVEEYKAKITKQFDELEEMMNKQMHLTHPELVEEKMYSINYKWHFISEEDRAVSYTHLTLPTKRIV